MEEEIDTISLGEFVMLTGRLGATCIARGDDGSLWRCPDGEVAGSARDVSGSFVYYVVKGK